MRSIVAILMVCGAGLVAADKICAVRNRDIQGQSSADADGIEDSFNINNHNQTDGDVKFERCNDYCYAFWQEENTSNGTIINIFSQGCWNQVGHDCENLECIGNKWTKALTNGKFCCCKGDYCNVNVTDPFENKLLLTSPATTEYLEQPDTEHLMLITVTTLACVLLVTLMVVVLIYHVYKNSLMMRLGKPLPYDDNYNEGNGLRTGTYTFDHLKLSTIVGEGRYGSVWQGSMGDQEVAVKIFPGHYQSYFMNERDIYRLPFIEHPSILHYYGSDERVSMDGNTEYLLVLSYAPGGTLTDFMRYHTFDWMAFCKMALSIVKGLAYLHTDYRKGDKFKPCVAHRDMNSNNILIKADGTCCICDLGLAVQIAGSKYFTNGEEQHAETKSINDVGTLLYMAPEVLEGAVNLRDCESSLKQIDVYAMGLILWELVSRCSDVYVPGSEVPPYRLPFEKEIGLHPTFEQMQVLVSRNKARPMLEGSVADKPGVRLIRETMEDCWDSDAEARLTALCIEERLMELQSHRITMYFTDGSPMMNSHCGLVPSTTNSLYSDAPHHDAAHHHHHHHHHHHQQHHHIVQMESNDVTVDNLVTLSPAESSSHEHSAKNSNETASSVHQQQQLLQPYQGRNPCMERNLMLQSDSCEELDCLGNVLVNKSSKHCASADSQGLVPHDYLGHHQQLIHTQQQHQLQLRPVTPIPYVQNVISESSGGGGSSSYNKLKQTNVQESCYTAPAISDSPRKRRFSGWSNLKKILASKKMTHHQPAYTRCHIEREDSKSNLLLASKNQAQLQQQQQQQQQQQHHHQQQQHSRIVEKADNSERPSTLPLVQLRKKTSLDESLNEVVSSSGNGGIASSRTKTTTVGDLPVAGSTHKIRRGGQAARFSLYNDRIMCNILTETDDDNARDGGVSSSSVPDFADEQLGGVAKDLKDVTCF